MEMKNTMGRKKRKKGKKNRKGDGNGGEKVRQGDGKCSGGGGEGGYLCLSVSSAAGRLLKGSLVAGEPTGRTRGAAVGGKTG